MQQRTAFKSLSVIALASIVPSALAVTASDKHEVPRTLEVTDTGVSKLRSGKTVVRAALPKVETERKSLRLSLDGFRVEGDPRLMPEALDNILAPWRGRELSFTEYEEAIHAVAQYLRENGHPGAQVRMSRAIIGQGKVMIAIEGLSPTEPAIAAAEVEPRVDVKGFKVTGTTMLDEAEIQSLLAEFTGKPLTSDEMERAAQSVANSLRAKGYTLVQAYLPPQRVDGGVVEIAVLEGRLDTAAGKNGLVLEGAGTRVKPEVIEAFLAHGAKPGEPLKVADLEQAVLLASDLPGVKSVKTQIEPGTETGTTQIRTTVEEGKLVSASLWGDNYGSRYLGEERVSGQFLINSPSGHGEQFGLNLVSSQGSRSIRVQGSAPLGSRGLRFGAAYADITADFSDDAVTQALDLNSQATIGTLNLSYPLIRSAQTNVNLALAYDYKRFITDLTWGRENDRVLNVGTAGASGDLVDIWGGQTKWAAMLAFGKLDLSNHAEYQDNDAITSKTEGGFTKFNWQASRVAPLAGNDRWSWMVATSGQIASKNLDSAEKFQLGGPMGVRAYPVSEGIGDNGWLVNAELRYRVPQQYLKETHLFAFADAGGITRYRDPWNLPGTGLPALGNTPNSYTLKGVGVGANLAIDNRGSIKLMWAKKVGENPNPTANNTDSDGTNKSGRIWILGNIVF